ncbi:hypothetical protein F7731_00700 [Cytobacillus depressus]|uniref:Uncharacterized protein n=1 Tax=Cytobacillus depressus TaxID=1602942 RepID=A0A6L3VFM5_9BACI|nr:hypothetical protein [Cytobacillus depressus]KAB2338125.1 hypothetical protein F7731_00700 [Cytobacillus depressus]
MPNYIWYFSLVFISIIIFIFTLKSTKDIRKNLSVYFFAAGLSFFGEFIVFILLDSYTYNPEVFQGLWQNNIFGSIISQGIFIPTILMAILAFQLKTKWVLLIISIVALIEEAFLLLRIYEHHWWETWYTTALLLLGSFIMKWWKRRLNNRSTANQFITIFMLLNTIFHPVSYFLTTVYHLKWYTPGLFDSIYKDHIIFNTLLGIIISIPVTVIILFSYNYFTLIIFAIIKVLFDYLLINKGILHVVDFKLVIATTILMIIIISVVKRASDLLFQWRDDFY